MKRRKQEAITTYISTLTVKLGSNQSTKSKPPSKDNFSKEPAEYEKSFPPTAPKRKSYESEFKPVASTTSVSLVKSLDSPKTKSSSNSSYSGVTKTSTRKSSSKEINTNITTTTAATTIEEKRTLSSAKSAKVMPEKPTTDYGETDWYLDILLRMQSTEMKLTKLHAQYDFLGKLAKENREDLKLSKDWARHNKGSEGRGLLIKI